MPRIHARNQSDTRVGALVSHVFNLSIFPPVSLLTLNSCPSPPSQPLAQDTCERITPLPASTAPRLYFYFYFLSLFLRTLGNDDLHLAAAVRHQYALYSITSLFLCIFLTFFRTFSYTSGTTTPRIPTPYQHRSLFITDHDLVVGTENVFKQPPFKDGLVSHSLLVSI